MPSASTIRVVWFMSPLTDRAPGRSDGHDAIARARSRSGTVDIGTVARMTTSPAPTPELRLLVDGVDFGEGPRWHDGRLWYSDFYQRAIYSVTAAGERTVMFGDLDDRPSGLGWMPDGSLLAVAMTSRSVWREVDGTLAAPRRSLRDRHRSLQRHGRRCCRERVRRQLRVRLRGRRHVRRRRSRARAGRRIRGGRRRGPGVPERFGHHPGRLDVDRRRVVRRRLRRVRHRRRRDVVEPSGVGRDPGRRPGRLRAGRRRRDLVLRRLRLAGRARAGRWRGHAPRRHTDVDLRVRAGRRTTCRPCSSCARRRRIPTNSRARRSARSSLWTWVSSTEVVQVDSPDLVEVVTTDLVQVGDDQDRGREQFAPDPVGDDLADGDGDGDDHEQQAAEGELVADLAQRRLGECVGVVGRRLRLGRSPRYCRPRRCGRRRHWRPDRPVAR